MQPTSFTCNRCGAPLTPGTTQCANCGQTFAAPVPYGPAPGFMPPPTPQKGPGGLIIGLIVAFFGAFFLIAIVAAVLFPVFAQARDKARLLVSESNLRQIGLATMQYMQDHNQTFPPTKDPASFKAALQPYVKQTGDKDIFTEPSMHTPYVPNPKLSNVAYSDLQNPHEAVLAVDNIKHNGNKVAILHADGSVDVEVVDGSTTGTGSTN